AGGGCVEGRGGGGWVGGGWGRVRLEAERRRETLREGGRRRTHGQQEAGRVRVDREPRREAEVSIEVREVRDEPSGGVAPIAQGLRQRHLVGGQREGDVAQAVDRFARKPGCREVGAWEAGVDYA